MFHFPSKIPMSRSCLRFCAWAAALASCGPVAVAAENEPLLQEVLVTGQKREQRAQDVGMQITAITGEQLSALGVTSSAYLPKAVSGLENAGSGNGMTTSYSLRGVAQNDFSLHQESPVAVYVDDVYVSQMAGGKFLLFDLDRVEVLRGPQGTLFGRNATGGLIHFVSQEPLFDTTSGFAVATLGSYSQRSLESAMNTSVGDNVAVRASILLNENDPIAKNRIGPDLVNGNDSAGRLQAKIRFPNQAATLLLRVYGASKSTRSGFYPSSPAKPTGFGNTGEFLPADEDFWGTGPGLDLGGYRDPDGRPDYRVDHDFIGFHRLKFHGAAAKATIELGPFELTSVSDYSELDHDYAEDSDGTPNYIFNFPTRAHVRQLSQELRLQRVTERLVWVGGVYGLRIDGQYGIAADIGPVLGGPIAVQSDFPLDTKSWSAFSQVEYALSDRLSATLGGRYINDRKSISFRQYFRTEVDGEIIPATLLGFPTEEILAFDGRSNDDLWSFKAELDFRFAPGKMLYASVNRGVKGGGFNGPLDATGGITAEQMSFGPEALVAYELGLKSEFADGRLRFNTSAYYYDYQDYQGLDFRGLTQLVFNTNAHIKGFDAELVAQVSPRLRLSGMVTLLDGGAAAVPLPSGVTVSRQMPFAADFSSTGSAIYQLDTARGAVEMQASVNFVGARYFGLTNAPVLRQENYATADARIAWRLPGEKVELAAFVNNMFDRLYDTVRFDISGLGFVERNPGLPRWAGVTVRYDF